MKPIVKVCGMTDAANIRQVESLDVDLLGFIFYPRSPRCVCSLPDYLPTRARRVGVFVNATQDEVVQQAARFGLHYIQLHGHESPDYCRSLHDSCGLPLIKAFAISDASDLQATSAYEGICRYFLFDTKCQAYGGSGRTFNWNLLQQYEGHTPFLLSGGIGPTSAPDLCDLRHPLLAGIDLNSRFETTAGIKDVALLRQFLRELEPILHPRSNHPIDSLK
ncbi:MAG: phosphoribosylanthranilate isomerase [Bacteroides sp.]